MKRVLLFIVLLGFTTSAMAKVVVGRVSIQKVLESVSDGKSAKRKLKKKFDGMQKKVQAEEKKIKKLQADYKKQSLVMSDKGKRKKEREIQAKILELQKKTVDYQKEIQKLEQKLKKPILEKVQGIIEAVSKKAKVDVTFESSTAPIVYVKTEKDLTDQVIKAYNAKYKKKKKK